MPTKINPETLQAKLKALSDEELLSASTANPNAFAELVDRYERAFVRKALSILGNEDDAYDAVQETFVRMYAAADKFKKRRGASLNSWGYAILLNQCKTIYSRNKMRPSVYFEQEPELLEVVADEQDLSGFDSKLTREYVMSLVSKLPELLRRAVVMHFLEGLPEKAIATAEHASNGAIRARIHRAKRELRKIASAMDFDQNAVPAVVRV
ncbi:RNA polymerase sigma factor [Patescibacteria group bacterium]|nr:RNA polymerase sigma factor [Patescibacteria group bacterium]MDE1946486.1 RNA polymerase sigma factor [Patescibacteria group bacterium]MDE2011162.1 RNA polymerase sigma factor [Patescibacteria group bacterium]MDE2233544.1 RNA polymerase sigma factor [Patescibacteria group bacterium]